MITHHTRQFIRLFFSLMRDLYRKGKRWQLLIPIAMVAGGLLIPQSMIIPVRDATVQDWNENSYWAYPWGKSITHKGVDIFADKGTEVLSATHGLVVWSGFQSVGGNAVIVMGPKWRFHYYAHLDSLDVFTLQPVSMGSVLGTVGNTGNAAGKPPHLHYTISTPLPHWWRWDDDIQGWQKMFYLRPDDYLRP